jgi:hypothetical protein
MFMDAYDTRQCQETCELVQQCWHGDPHERPTFSSIVQAMSTIRCISKLDRRQVAGVAGGKDSQPACACTVM